MDCGLSATLGWGAWDFDTIPRGVTERFLPSTQPIPQLVLQPFNAQTDVKGTQVQVEVYRGVVQLSGFVDRPAEAQRAVTVARNVAGVKEVRNNLIVK